MSLASLSPQSASSTHSSSAGSPTNMDRTPPENMVDSQELERRLRAVRDRTPLAEDSVDRFKAKAQQYYDELVALGGRPTGPIQHYPSCKTTMADGMHHYRDEYETIQSIFEVDKRRASFHWGEEMAKWGEELFRWQKFKEAQRIQHQGGQSELELELESSDAALVEVVSKLNDWQEFEITHERKVYHAEAAYEKCQQRHAANQNAMVGITSADVTLNIQEPHGGWTYYMGKVQKELEDLQKFLMWVKSQWTDVIAEACSSIAAAPKLQEELETKFETQANAIYRCLQHTGARPSRAVQSPDTNAELPQRIQHWNSEISTFTSELWDWKIFRSWRRRVKDSGNMDQEGRELLCQGDSCSELFEDLLKYQQQNHDKAASWVNCWRHQARQYMEARTRRLQHIRQRWPSYNDDDEDEDDDDDDNEVSQARKAEYYALHAEEKVSVAAKRLEESKQKLRDILVESSPTSTAKHLVIQRFPTPPKSQSPESLSGRRRPSTGREPAGKSHRRSKKERARKGKEGMANINTEQHALPPFSLDSRHLKEHDDDIEMSDHAEKPNQADSEDTVMSDVEHLPNHTPPSPPESHPRPTANKNHRKLPSLRKGHRRSKKQKARKGEARMANINIEQHALPPFSLGSNHMEEYNDGIQMLDHTEDSNLVGIKKEPNQADYENKVMSGVEDPLSQLPPSPPESQPRPTANKNHRKLPSPNSQSQTSRKTRSSTKLDQVSSGKILKKSSKNKPRQNTKDFTDQQTTALLGAASTSCPSTNASSLGRNEPESYPKPTADTNHGKSPSSSSQISTSRKTRPSKKLDQAASSGILKKSSKTKPPRNAKAFTEQQTMTLLDAASNSCPSTNVTSLGRNIPESSPKPTADSDHRESSSPSSRTPTSSYQSANATSLGRNIPEPYQKPTADTDHTGFPSPGSQSPMSKKTQVDQIPSGKILKKSNKDKPRPPRRSERLKKKAVAASNRRA